MTGPEHYTKAEQFLTDAKTATGKGQVQQAQLLISAAQVHATLAQAAATALDVADDGTSGSRHYQWEQVAG